MLIGGFAWNFLNNFTCNYLNFQRNSQMSEINFSFDFITRVYGCKFNSIKLTKLRALYHVYV